MTQDFNQEAERLFPFKEDKRASNGELYQTDSKRKDRETFISGCEFGYKEGVEEGLKFAEWCDLKATWSRSRGLWSPHDDFKYYTTAELYQIFKQEQDGNK
jgi:hypothetical protein